MATKNLRISVKCQAKGARRFKLPEDLTSIIACSNKISLLNEKSQYLLEKNVISAKTLEEQIIGMRQLIMLIDTSKNEIDEIHEDTKDIRLLADIVTNWFFNLSSNSCLKPVIASAINKSEETGGMCSKIFSACFDNYINYIIDVIKIPGDSNLCEYIAIFGDC